MPDDQPSLPSIPEPPVNIETALGESGLPTSLRIMIDDKLFDRVRLLAKYMAEDTAFTPKHLRDKPTACFTVLSQALNWKLDPHFVARCTYETPGGSIGFMGSLVQAVIEQSGRLVGGIEREYVGDWSALVGKFEKKASDRGKEFIRPTWTATDAKGLGIIIRARLKGEERARVWPAENEPFFLTQCFPLNSPLWASDPKTQIGYLAIRRFANQAVPGLLGGMPFDEDALLDASERARDITHDIAATHIQAAGDLAADQTQSPEPWRIFDQTGEAYEFERSDRAAEACRKVMIAAANVGADALHTVWDNNQDFLNDLEDEGLKNEAAGLERLYESLDPGDPSGTLQPAEKAQAAADEVMAVSGIDFSTMAGGSGSAAPAEATSTASPEKTPEPAGDVSMIQSRERHDPFWDRPSLRVDPPIDPSRAGRRLPAWKPWPAMIRPRIRQAWSTETLNALYSDNEDNLQSYGASQGERDRDELMAEFEAARDRLGAT